MNGLERTVSRADMIRALLAAREIAGAARLLHVDRRTVARSMRAYGLCWPRACRISGEDGWRAVFEQHGPELNRIVRAVAMNRTYVAQQLDRYGIRPILDAYARAWEDAA